MMKGTVVYLAETKMVPENVDFEEAARKAGLDPAWTEFSSGCAGFYSLNEALLELLKRGAAAVTCVGAVIEGGGLKLGTASARLAG